MNTGNALAEYLLDENEDDLARKFILGQTPEQIAARERKATAKVRQEEFFREHDKKYSAQRALGEVTPDTDAGYFWHKTETYSDGRRALQVRRNGTTQRWVSRPEEFRIPCKYGMYRYFDITQQNASEWTTFEPPLKPVQLNLRGMK